MKSNYIWFCMFFLFFGISYSQNLPGWFMNPPKPPDRIVVVATSFSSSEENAGNTAMEDARTKISEKINKYSQKEFDHTLSKPQLFVLLDFVKTSKTASIRDRNVFQAFVMVEINKRDIHSYLKKPMMKSPPPKPKPRSATITKRIPDGYFLNENFDSVQEGMIPRNWFGGEKLIVKSERGRKFLTDFAKQKKHILTIPDLDIANNFEISYSFQFGHDKYNTHAFLHLGNITTVIDVLGWCKLNDSKDVRRIDFRNSVVKVTLQKKGPVFKLYVNGEERIINRNSNFKPADTIRLEFQNMTGFKLFYITGKSL